MSEQYIGEVRLMPYTYAPVGWLLCSGQLMSINQNQTLFSLLGTMYGGDGQTTFGLPNLGGRIPIGQGGGYTMGQSLGSETVALTGDHMPAHSHPLMADPTTPASVNSNVPTGGLLGQGTGATNPGSKTFALSAYGNGSVSSQLAAASIGSAGGQPHENRQPYLALNYCIAAQGVYPDRQ